MEAGLERPGKNNIAWGAMTEVGAIVIAGLAVNPVSSAADSRAPTTVGVPAPAAPTELPPAQAISPAPNISPIRNDSRRAAAPSPGTSRDTIIDPRTDAVVFRSLDAQTGAVIDQIPSRALLRQRAYGHAQTVQALISGKDVNTASLTAAPDIDTTA
jgi:hypothetical protein